MNSIPDGPWAYGPRRRRGLRRTRWSVVAAATAFFLVASSSIAFATVRTDQEDYAPGSVVTISGDNSNGAGYLPGETVVVNVSGPNGYEASCEAVADENGAWSCQVTLWDSALAGGDYTYTATGQNSGTTESGVFTDATYKITTAALEIRKGDCSAAQSTFTSGDTVCARATVTGTTTGSGTVASDTLYVRWFDASNTLKFSDNISFAANGSQDVTHAVTVTSNETWTVKACNNPNCLSGGTNEVFDTETFNVTVQTPTNIAPSITSLTGPTSVDESGTAERTYSFSFTDPDADTWSFVSGYPTCGAGGSLVTGSASINQVNKTGEFKCVFDDGPASPTVAVKIFDGTAASNEAALDVAVLNVAPTVAQPSFGAASIDCRNSVTLSGISFNDPGLNDAPWNVNIHWGDGSTDTNYNTNSQGSQSNQTHTYNSPGTFTATVTVKDKDGGEGSNMSSNAVVVNQVYAVDFLPPFDDSSPSGLIINKMKNGRVVPVKATIFDKCTEAYVNDPMTQVTIKVSKTSGNGSSDSIEEYADAGQSSAGTNAFRWTTDSTAPGGGFWIYNLDSKALGLVVGNLYRIDIYVGEEPVKNLATRDTWAVLQPVK